MDREHLEALLTRAALDLVDRLPPPADDAEALRLVSRLRADGLSPVASSAVVGQLRLREAARAKFGEFASRLLYTPAGLEQATRLRVASLRAGRYRDAGVARVVDLGCGIGADALAVAALGIPVLAVDADEVTAAIATYNLAAFPDATVRHGEAEDVTLAAGDAVFLDPARRRLDTGGGRLRDPEQFSPPLSFALGLAAERAAAVKLGPALDRSLIPPEAEAQWVSVDRSVVEVCLYSGPLARPGVRRSALVLGPAGVEELSAPAESAAVPARALGEYLVEPDGAVIRSGLLGLLADRLDAGVVSDGIAYLTTDRVTPTVLGQTFRVLERLPAREKELARALRDRGVGRLEIKKRGADIDPAVLRRRLRLEGPDEATVVLTREGGRHVTLLVERVDATPASREAGEADDPPAGAGGPGISRTDR